MLYQKAKNIYWRIDNLMQDLGVSKVPFFICKETPNIKVKHQIITFARKLGLKSDGRGTLRLTLKASKYNENGEEILGWYPNKIYEVYLHCCHRKKDYFSAKDSRNMLTLGFYVGG